MKQQQLKSNDTQLTKQKSQQGLIEEARTRKKPAKGLEGIMQVAAGVGKDLEEDSSSLQSGSLESKLDNTLKSERYDFFYWISIKYTSWIYLIFHICVSFWAILYSIIAVSSSPMGGHLFQIQEVGVIFLWMTKMK